MYRSARRRRKGSQSQRWRRNGYNLSECDRKSGTSAGNFMNAIETQTPLSVLVIDDEAQIQRLLTIALETNGHRVTTAGEGRLGIAAAAQRRHDAIILELGLPDVSGIEGLRNLRARAQTPV